jgi:hypothetical protein
MRPAPQRRLALALFGLRTNGEEFPIEATISQVETGDEMLYTVILRDISVRKTYESPYATRAEVSLDCTRATGYWDELL